jgi:hypothetical protein
MGGKASGAWISVSIVLENVPELIAKDFVEYFKNGCGRDAKNSGLFVYNEGMKIQSVYITDRSKTTTLKPANSRQLKTFEQAYVDSSEANPAAFFVEELSNHKDRVNIEASSHDKKFNVAETVGSGNLSERAGRASLMREFQRLRPVLRTSTPKATLPSSTDSPPPASSSSVPKRRSNGAADSFAGFEEADLDFHPTRDADSFSKEANCIME